MQCINVCDSSNCMVCTCSSHRSSQFSPSPLHTLPSPSPLSLPSTC